MITESGIQAFWLSVQQWGEAVAIFSAVVLIVFVLEAAAVAAVSAASCQDRAGRHPETGGPS